MSTQLSNNTEKRFEIFISHSSADKELGELFLDFLLFLGFNKNNIFYSSKYHHGVSLGKNFADVVKENLKNADIIVYLLTNNFYNSHYCQNEIGAGWISDDKDIITILLNGLDFNDMKGFIGPETKAFSIKSSEKEELYNYFARKTTVDFDEKVAKQKYDDFINNHVTLIKNKIDLNDKEKQIINGLKKSVSGMAPYINALNVVSITVEGQNICESKDLAERLEYIEAIDHLVELGLIRKKGAFLSLTSKGMKSGSSSKQSDLEGKSKKH